MNKKVSLALLTTAGVMAISITGATFVHAQATDSNNFSPVIQRLVEKFNLDQNQVQQMVTDYRQERQQQMTRAFEDRLSQAVQEGKVTPAQKELILKKHAELQAEHQSDWQQFQNMTPQERQQHRQQEREKMQQWAQDNGIDLQYLMFGQGFGRKGGMGRGMHGGYGPMMNQSADQI